MKSSEIFFWMGFLMLIMCLVLWRRPMTIIFGILSVSFYSWAVVLA